MISAERYAISCRLHWVNTMYMFVVYNVIRVHEMDKLLCYNEISNIRSSKETCDCSIKEIFV